MFYKTDLTRASPCVTEHQIFPKTISWKGEVLHLMQLQSCPSLQPGSNISNNAHSDWSIAGECQRDIHQPPAGFKIPFH